MIAPGRRQPLKALPLRAVAEFLVRYGVAKESDRPHYYELPGLLKTGEIRAVAFFEPFANQPVPILPEYWMLLGPDELQPLCINTSKRLK